MKKINLVPNYIIKYSMSSGNDTMALMRSIQAGTGRRGVVRRRRGGSKFTDFFTKTIPGFAKSAWNHIKTKPLSSIGSALSYIPGIGGIAGRAVGAVGGLTGTGRRRKRRGGSLSTALKSAHAFVKKNKLASKLARHVGFTNVAKGLASAGYGRKPRKRRVAKRKGGSLSSALKSAHSFIKKHQVASKLARHVGFTNLAKGLHASGYGRRKKRRVARR
jgi:hypothetical protein